MSSKKERMGAGSRRVGGAGGEKGEQRSWTIKCRTRFYVNKKVHDGDKHRQPLYDHQILHGKHHICGEYTTIHFYHISSHDDAVSASTSTETSTHHPRNFLKCAMRCLCFSLVFGWAAEHGSFEWKILCKISCILCSIFVIIL